MKNSITINHFKLFFVTIVSLFLTTLSCAKDNYECIEMSEYSQRVLDTANKKRVSNLFKKIISEKATINKVINELKKENQISNLDIEDNRMQNLFIVLRKAARRNDTLDGFQYYLKSHNNELVLLLDDFQINSLYKNIRKNTFLGYVDSLPSVL